MKVFFIQSSLILGFFSLLDNLSGLSLDTVLLITIQVSTFVILFNTVVSQKMLEAKKQQNITDVEPKIQPKIEPELTRGWF
jgi:hypothetical protein